MKPIQKHKIPIGRLVELESGVRLFVIKHSRDCDGDLTYTLAWRIGGTMDSTSGHHEDSLIEITIDDTQPAATQEEQENE